MPSQYVCCFDNRNSLTKPGTPATIFRNLECDDSSSLSIFAAGKKQNKLRLPSQYVCCFDNRNSLTKPGTPATIFRNLECDDSSSLSIFAAGKKLAGN